MSDNQTETDRLARARAEADRHHQTGGFSTASSPDDRTILSILAGILDALIVIAERMPGEDSAAVCPHGLTGLCMYCVQPTLNGIEMAVREAVRRG